MNLSQKIESLINETIDVYRDNFKLLISLSLLLSLAGIVYQVITSLLNLPETANLIVNFLLALAYYYYVIRLTIALIIVIIYRAQGKEIDLSQSYELAGGCFWRYLWTSLKLALFVAVPVLLLFFTITLNTSVAIKFISILVLGLMILVLFFYFGFAPFLSIFNSSSENHFSRSKRLVESDMYLVLSVLALVLLAHLILFLFSEYLLAPIGLYSGIMTILVDSAINVFTTPFFLGVHAILFLRLSNRLDEADGVDQTIEDTPPSDTAAQS